MARPWLQHGPKSPDNEIKYELYIYIYFFFFKSVPPPEAGSHIIPLCSIKTRPRLSRVDRDIKAIQRRDE